MEREITCHSNLLAKLGQAWDLSPDLPFPPFSQNGSREGRSDTEGEGPQPEGLLSRGLARASWAGRVS